MREHDIGAVPVGENDRLVGMITDRDITIRAVAEDKELSQLTARDVMTSGIIYCRDTEKGGFGAVERMLTARASPMRIRLTCSGPSVGITPGRSRLSVLFRRSF
ncbi:MULTISPECIES: CBS domain-containing protein [Methylocystis]|uniref:CBS domain-containing protein n=1 Tax=Methylocystis TaxID=133 RepID=UPI00248F66F9|nr:MULTISPECIES: CBS domain-containing protein [Methylocystis]MDJ0450918.1 CBS domain-containing protein [Methylocystis sp. JR02]